MSCGGGTQVIDLTDGAQEYTWPLTLTEKTGKNISADSVQIAVGTLRNSTSVQTWVTPDIVTESTITAKEFMLANPSVSGVIVPTGQDPATFLLYQVSAQIMIGALTGQHPALTPTAGDYYASLRLTDSSEVVPRRGPKFTVS